MPLLSGSSKEVIASNISELESSGRSHKVAVAAALHNAYDTGAGVLLTHGDRALFLKRGPRARDHAGEWCCPGGSIEEGETPEQAARREAQEETGNSGLAPGDLTKLDEGLGFTTFRARVEEEFEPLLNHEHDEFQWAPMSDAPQPLHPGVAATLKKLLSTAVAAGEQESEAQKQAAAMLDAAPFAREGSLANAEKLDALKRTDRHNANNPVLATTPDLPAGALDKREYDTNGWFEVLDNPLSKVGVYQYSEASILKGGDPKKMIGVLRSPQELGNDETVKSFRLMPWLDDHPATLLGPESKGLKPAEDKGVEGVIGEKTYFKDGVLYGNIKVFSEALAKKLASGKRELSLGYYCDFVPEAGVFEGQPYQYAQKNLRGNHGASVRSGRMGSDVRVLDAAEPLALAFALDLKEGAAVPEKRKDEMDCTLDADTQKFIEDSFGSLVGELERKGYSKEYATKVAGKVAAEKGMTGHHDSTDKGTTMAGKDADPKGDVKDPEKDALDAENAEAEADEKESAKDAAEEKDDEKKEDKEAMDRRRARDKRAGARDQRKSARDKRAKDAKDAKDAAEAKAAKDAAEAKAAKDAAEAAGAKGKGMDAAEVAALVKQEVAANTAAVVPTIRKEIRREEAFKHKLYERLSPIVGAFDHAEMSHIEMAAYGLKKLGVKDEAADPVTALDFMLLGRTQVAEARQGARARVNGAQDSKGDTFIDRYIAA